jgi:hypothetical protein
MLFMNKHEFSSLVLTVLAVLYEKDAENYGENVLTKQARCQKNLETRRKISSCVGGSREGSNWRWVRAPCQRFSIASQRLRGGKPPIPRPKTASLVGPK